MPDAYIRTVHFSSYIQRLIKASQVTSGYVALEVTKCKRNNKKRGAKNIVSFHALYSLVPSFDWMTQNIVSYDAWVGNLVEGNIKDSSKSKFIRWQAIYDGTKHTERETESYREPGPHDEKGEQGGRGVRRKSIQVLLVFAKLKSGFQSMTYYRCLVSALNFNEKRQPVENRSDAFNRLAKRLSKTHKKRWWSSS
jgi:hypothetical protein